MAQKDPLVEYRGEGHIMFEELSKMIREEVVFTLFHVEVQPRTRPSRRSRRRAERREMLSYEHETAAGADVIAAAGGREARAAVGHDGPSRSARSSKEHRRHRPQRPCWCGSGKKFKTLPRR